MKEDLNTHNPMNWHLSSASSLHVIPEAIQSNKHMGVLENGRYTLMVDTKMVKRCQAWELISRGGGTFQSTTATAAMRERPFKRRCLSSAALSLQPMNDVSLT